MKKIKGQNPIVLAIGAIAIVAGVVVMLKPAAAPEASTQSINVDFPADLSAREKEVMTGALQILMMKCPDLPKYWGQTTGGKAAFLPAYVAENGGQKASRGWGRMIELQATVKPDAKLPNGWNAWNHTLSWRMGGGEKPGILMIKPQAARFCGRTSGDSVVDAPLQFIE